MASSASTNLNIHQAIANFLMKMTSKPHVNSLESKSRPRWTPVACEHFVCLLQRLPPCQSTWCQWGCQTYRQFGTSWCARWQLDSKSWPRTYVRRVVAQELSVEVADEQGVGLEKQVCQVTWTENCLPWLVCLLHTHMAVMTCGLHIFRGVSPSAKRPAERPWHAVLGLTRYHCGRLEPYTYTICYIPYLRSLCLHTIYHTHYRIYQILSTIYYIPY